MDDPGAESRSHWASEPDSKSSWKYVPGATPEPARLTAWGLSAALSFTDRVARRSPSVPGAKVTVIEQLAPAARLAGQFPPRLKSAAPSPPSVMPAMSSGPPPVFESETVCCGLVVPRVCESNLSAPGEMLATGAERPRPLSVTVCGLDGALSPITSEAVRSPPSCGVNET